MFSNLLFQFKAVYFFQIPKIDIHGSLKFLIACIGVKYVQSHCFTK
jgi:hypothetical protein